MRSFEENLAQKNTLELSDLCVRLGVQEAGRGAKKETVRLILARMREDLFPIPAVLGSELLDLLADLLRGAASDEGDWSIPVSEITRDEAAEDLILWLGCFGLAHRTRTRWEIVPEAARLLPQSEAEYSRIDDLSDILFDARKRLNVYGMLTPQELAQMMSGENEEELCALLSALCLCWGGLNGLHRGADGEVWLVSELCEEPEELYDILSTPMLKAFPHYLWPESFYLDSDFVVPFQPDDIQYLTRLARERGVAVPDLEDVMLEACIEMQAMKSEDALTWITDLLGEMDSGAVWLISRCIDRLPLWVFKGRSREGMLREYMKENTPVHPAAACPCGSGKPWGMCHGKMN